MNHNESINSIVINVLSEKQTIKSLTAHVLQLCAMLETHDQPATQAPQPTRKPTVDGRKPRDYGPSSTRKATRLDAWQIIFGDHCNNKARQIADELGLSRGQVYSIQGGYTFRDVAIDEFEMNNHTDAHNDELFTANFVGPIAA